jgi:N-acetylgalactosamine-6-sulfatase
MTGRYSFRYSIHYALSDPAQNHKINQADWLDARAHTLPRLLKTVGYHTAHIGKWHLGDGEPHLIGAPTMADYGIDESLVYHGPGPQLNQRQIGLEAVSAIERMKGQQPFYLNVWLHEMHTKHFPTQESMDAFKHLDPRRQVYAATLRDGDNNVGMVLEALKRQGMEDNTIVMFSSDNGPAGAAYSANDRAPRPEDGDMKKGFGIYYSAGSTGGLRGRKAKLFEGGVRVPFIVRWPGHTPAGEKNDSTVFTAIDMMPTICAAAGVKLPNDHLGDGENLLAAFEGKSVRRTKPLFWKAPGVGRDADTWCQWAMREGNWKLYADPVAKRVELYDLAKDRAEKSDVSKDNPEMVERMKAELLEWVATLPKSPDPVCVSSGHAHELPKTTKPGTTQRTTPEQRSKAFARWDANHDEQLTLDEYKAGLKGQDDLDARFKRFDHNGDGKLTGEEFTKPIAK